MKAWWAALHFLSPHWLWLLLAVPVIYLSFHVRDDVRARWKRYIDSDLLDHLIVTRKRSWRFRPIHMVCLLIVLGSIALAGPTWKREQPPFTEDTAPLVIALDLSQTMDAIDLNPTRLERAKLKLRDLLRARAGARTALFVYAGTTHMVLPFTTDDSLFDLYLSSLSTQLMPVSGKDTVRALNAIEDFLNDETVPGTILFVTDGIEQKALPRLKQFAAQEGGKDDILVMGVGTSRGGPIRAANNGFLTDASGKRIYSTLDVNALRSLGGLDVGATTLTLNDDDIHWVQRRIQHHLQAQQQSGSNRRWINEGYWLVIPIAAMAAFWFRKGWTVRWTYTALAIFIVLPPSGAGNHISWMDLWLTRDQQGRYYFERGEYLKASECFQDPLWKGLAFARAGDDEDALNAFALSDSAESWYDQGNALARLNRYPEAVQVYQQVLSRRHPWTEAQENLDLVKSLIPAPKKKQDKNKEQESSPELPPDKVQFDEKGMQGTKAQMKLDPQKMAEIWMRNIQTTPADFLRRRFQIQAAQEHHQ